MGHHPCLDADNRGEKERGTARPKIFKWASAERRKRD